MRLCFPKKVLDQHAAVLGKTGAGKSSAMRHVVEYLLSEGKRVAIIDPKGDWWGLKSSADGKGAGFPVIAFGNFKSDEDVSDVPINEESGKDVAELLVGGNRPAIIGFRGWYTAHMLKFWIDFAKGLFHGNQGELYLFIDEVQNFAPKGSTRAIEGQGGLALHWCNRLLAEGRGLGINIWIGAQRPQKVHNDTLDGCETLVAMRSVHPAAREALSKWMQGAADKEKSALVLDALGSMKRANAFIWSPEIEFGPEKVEFPMFTTFDSFAPPQLQKKVSRKGWADVDLDVVKEKLARIVEEKKANDPKELHRQIHHLQRQLTSAIGRVTTTEVEKRVEVTVPAISEKDLERLEGLLAGIHSEARFLGDCLGDLLKALGPVTEGLAKARQPQLVRELAKRPTPAPSNAKIEPKESFRPAAERNGALPAGEAKVLVAVAQYGTIERDTISVLTGYKRATRDAYIDRLRKVGFVEAVRGEPVTITNAGRAALPENFTPLPTGDALRQYWLERLPEGESRIMAAMLPHGTNQVDREELSNATGYKRATRDAYLQRMRSKRIVEDAGPGFVRLSANLFS